MRQQAEASGGARNVSPVALTLAVRIV